MTSLLTFYLKGSISLDQNFVQLSSPNTIFGLIPLGSLKQNVPVSQIASVSTTFHLKLFNLLIGAFLVLFGPLVILDGDFGPGLLLMLLGASLAINAFQTNLIMTTTDGGIRLISFLVFEKEKAQQATDNINLIVSNRLNNTNNQNIIAANNANTDRIVDAINFK